MTRARDIGAGARVAIGGLIAVALLAIACGSGGPSVSTSTAGKVAFVSTRDGNAEIYLMNEDGSSLRRLTDNAAVDDLPVWSPDGKRIAFLSNRHSTVATPANRTEVDAYFAGFDIYVMNADGRNQKRVSNNAMTGSTFDWSPDGQSIVYATATGMYVTDTKGGERRLTDTPVNDRERDPVWSPDGAQVAFTSYTRRNDDVFVMNADASSPIRVSTSNWADGSAQWSPDGKRLAFTSNRDGRTESQTTIVVVDADGKNLRPATREDESASFPAWSPDGAVLAYIATRDNGGSDIYVVRPIGLDRVRVTSTLSSKSRPVWLADGRIAFGVVAGGEAATYTVKADGSDLVRLNAGPDDSRFAWSPAARE